MELAFSFLSGTVPVQRNVNGLAETLDLGSKARGRTMKITFQNPTDNNTESIEARQAQRGRSQGPGGAGRLSGVRIDLSGGERQFAGQAEAVSAFAQIQQAAGTMDAKTQQDYMTLMSNTMSEEDYKKLQEDGFSLRQMDPEEAVTILDKIKAEMARSGKKVAGYNDDLDRETLEAALGSQALALAVERSFSEADLPITEETLSGIRNAWEMASALEELPDGAYQFMIRSGMEPEIENFYLAGSSGAGAGNGGSARFYEEDVRGYLTRTADGTKVPAQELQDQIDKVIRESGQEPNQESRERASWLLERNLPLTAENLAQYQELASVSFPVTEEVFSRAAAKAVQEGKRPEQGNLAETGEETLYQKAGRLLEQYAGGESGFPEGRTLADRRLLEEIRLRMTAEVNVKLLQSGFSIDTSSMEELVEALKAAERQVAERYFPGDEGAVSKYETFQAVNQAVGEIPGMPAQLLGSLRLIGNSAFKNGTAANAGNAADAADFAGQEYAADETHSGETANPEKLTTLSEFYRSGKELQQEYEKARESYETLMTAPRADMGDSIRKAFANVDEILSDLGLDLSEENRKAVRVLGYNRMDLSLENIRRVREAQRLVSGVVNKMTPSSVLEMIRDGINPLEKNFEELEEYFERQPRDKDRQAEDYSHFLFRLERRGDISKEERESFIGIYRMLHQIGKRDGAAVGAALNARSELNFSGLLSAARSEDFTAMDVRFSGQEESYVSFLKADNAIDRQIETAYLSRELEEIRSAAQVSRGAGELLERGEVPVNVDHLLAAEGLITEETLPFGRAERALLRNLSPEEKAKGSLEPERSSEESAEGVMEAPSQRIPAEDSPLAELRALWEKLDGPDFREEYAARMGDLEDAVEQEIWQAESSLDVRELRLLAKQLSIAGALSSKEEYYLPIEVDGRTAKLHLTLEQGGTEKGKVTAEVESGGGKTWAELRLQDGKVTGFLQGNGPGEVMKLIRASDIFSGYLREETTWSMDAKLPVIDMAKAGETAAAVRGNRATDKFLGGAVKETGRAGQPEQAELYRLAKMWIRAVTQKEVENEDQL